MYSRALARVSAELDPFIFSRKSAADGEKELAANYAGLREWGAKTILDAPHSRNRRNSRLILFPVRGYSEIQTSIECKPSICDRKICLRYATGRIGGCESPEVGVVDILNHSAGYKSPTRIVHHIQRIDADFELFLFGNPDARDEVHVESGMRRSFEPGAAETADRSRRCIRQNDIAVSIDKGLVAEVSLQSLQCCDAVLERIVNLPVSVEVVGPAHSGRNLAGALGEVAQNHRRVSGAGKIDGSRNHRPRGLCVRRRDRHWRTGTPAEDTAQLPPFDQSRHETRRVAKELPARPEGQFERTVAPEIMCAMEGKQSVIEMVISRILIFEAAVGTVFAQSPAPRVGKLMGESVR